MSDLRISGRLFFQFLAALFLLATGVTCLFSQAANTTVLGTVKDSAGAVMAGVSVRAKNIDTDVTQSAVTNGSGQFRVSNLPVGTYEVEAAMPGFRTIIRRPVILGLSGSVIVDFSLEVGSSEETIFVEATVPLVETHSPALSSISTFDEKQLKNLPLNGRNLSELITMNPGVSVAMADMPSMDTGWGGNMRVTIYGAGENHSVSGARSEGQAILLDNTNIQGFWNRGAGTGAVGSWLGVEGIAGMQVLTSSYGAQFGGNGSVINLATKPGTNTFHGSAYEFLRNSALNARNFFDTTTDPLPSRSNQFGATLGGPVQKEKLFFFFNYEGLRRAQNQSLLAYVPDANVRRGILPGLSSTIAIDPTIKPILDLYPLPNGRNLGGGVGEYLSSADLLAHENYFLGRVDWVLSPRDSLFARYISDRGDSIQPYMGSQIPLWPEQDQTANQYFTVEERRAISRFMMNAVRFSTVRPVEAGRTSTRHDALQFLNLGRDDAWVDPGGGVSPIGSNLTLPFSLVQNRFAFADDVTWIRGAHSLQFGASVERIQSNTNTSYFAAGWYSFDGLESFLHATPYEFDGVNQPVVDGSRDFREVAVAPYFQDEWKVRSNLTVNIGLRYDYASNPVGVRHPLFTMVNPPNGTLERVTNVFKSSPNKKNWDPRFGFAWDPFKNHKTSVRWGFGVFHDRVGPRTYFQAFTSTPPFSFASRFGPSFPNPFSTPTAPSFLTTLNGVLFDLRQAPYQMEWSLSLQREILNSVVTVGYVGSRGVHLLVTRDLNPPKAVVGPDGQNYYATLTPIGVRPVPRINPSLSRIYDQVPDGNSNYHSLQLSFDRRVTRQLNAMLSYTWSKCIDNSSSTFAFEQQAAGPFFSTALSNAYDARADRGRCTWDRRHSFRGGTMISLPFQKNRLVDNWMISAIVMANSGRPFSVTDGFDISGLGSPIQNSRPDVIANCDAILGNVDRWYDPACFSLQQIGRPGNLGRNTLTGPAFFTTDLALIKDIKLRESATVQFRAEVFNALNHPNFGQPNTDLFVFNASGGLDVNPAAGKITTTTTPGRQIQFGLKIFF
jgi:outer membrane receptor protein involved in Fe transport